MPMAAALNHEPNEPPSVFAITAISLVTCLATALKAATVADTVVETAPVAVLAITAVVWATSPASKLPKRERGRGSSM